MSVLEIKNLHVSVEGKEILKGVSFKIKSGEVVGLLGPNGNGKSTLFAAIMGNPKYKVLEGEVLLDGVNLLNLSVDERSKAGIFLGFQNPVEIPGVISADFYKAAINARSENRVSLYKFYKTLEDGCKSVELPFEFVNRGLNDGFSGGERKRNEILQMKLLNPKFALLDEIDSGLDVDAINLISKSIVEQQQKGSGFIIISHYARLFELINVSRVLIVVNGKIALEGDSSLIKRIDKEGYDWLKREHNIVIEEEHAMNKVSIGTCATKEVIKNGNK